jgi:pyrroline-5-carboxylate reductase
MGTAILSGIVGKYMISVSEINSKKALKIRRKFAVKTQSLPLVIQESNVIILAVKPQDFDKVLKEISSQLKEEKVFISIAAGITTSYIEQRLGRHARVVRTMPNLPAQVGQSMTGVCAGKKAKKTDLNLTVEIFNHIGRTVVIDEKHIDSITAISGSGPAYIFYFMECLQQAAKSLGLKDNLAKDLVFQTVKGSAMLLDIQKLPAAELRKRVTSKGGTTEAAIKSFMKHNLDKTLQAAVKSARDRAKELSK